MSFQAKESANGNTLCLDWGGVGLCTQYIQVTDSSLKVTNILTSNTFVLDLHFVCLFLSLNVLFVRLVHDVVFSNNLFIFVV